MDRRKILLVVAVLVAAMGSALVFVYTRGADDRAAQKFDTVEVLTATATIAQGESIADALAANKIAPTSIAADAVLSGAQTSTDALADTSALTTIYPGEQILAEKFGTSAEPASPLQIPDGMMAISVNLTDTARVAGFVNPGSEVAIFVTGTSEVTSAEAATAGQSVPPAGAFAQLLMDKVLVLGVGSTTPVSTTTTDDSGASTAETLPRTLLTLAVDQDQAQRLIFASSNGELSFGLLTDKSEVAPAAATTFDTLFG